MKTIVASQFLDSRLACVWSPVVSPGLHPVPGSMLGERLVFMLSCGLLPVASAWFPPVALSSPSDSIPAKQTSSFLSPMRSVLSLFRLFDTYACFPPLLFPIVVLGLYPHPFVVLYSVYLQSKPQRSCLATCLHLWWCCCPFFSASLSSLFGLPSPSVFVFAKRASKPT